MSILNYLRLVYPTSESISQFSEEQAKAYYEKLLFFYRVPLASNGFKGLFSEEIKPEEIVFYNPDTVAIGRQDLDDSFNGFVSNECIQGSSRDYIEINSFAWEQFPYGGYYNWAKGSGIYVHTEGKTISGNTKLLIIYQILEDCGKKEDYIKQFSKTPSFVRQILGRDQIPRDLKQLFFTEISDVYLENDVPIFGKIPTLLGSILQNKSRNSLLEEIRGYSTDYDIFKYFIEEYYIKDHELASSFQDLSNMRYRYILAEVAGTSEQDQWLYETAKSCGYYIVQAVRQPNYSGSVTFEIVDTRWPIVNIPNVQNDSGDSGVQNYNLFFVWKKLLEMNIFSRRDPFDVYNQKKEVLITNFDFPNISVENCAVTNVKDPPSDFDPQWLPKEGWGKEACVEEAGAFPTDTISFWLTERSCPFPLNKGVDACRLINFGIDASKQGGFSVKDMMHNVKIFKNVLRKNQSCLIGVGLSCPVEVSQSSFSLDISKVPDQKHQVWNGYTPECSLKDQSLCKFYPVQTANIKVDNIYDGIEIKGDQWAQKACEVALESVATHGGGPFGAVILQLDGEAPEDGVYTNREILRYWTNFNHVTLINDPTAHAEVMTIRSACQSLGVFNLGEVRKEDSLLPQPSAYSHCIIYINAEPCPMCYGAISWSRIKTLIFSATRYDSAVQGVDFSDEDIYSDLQKDYRNREINIFRSITDNSLDAFNLYKRTPHIDY